ncbi:MAG: peptidoglycan-associated lipoprotein Pal [Proteobacteria bacterium]|nr:peptidoglycan-associated lipoprotein Pal [Pseudomonadota bacterium]
MRTKFVIVFAALFLVAACETAPEETASTAGAGAAAETTTSAGVSGEAVSAQPSTSTAGPTPGTQEDLVVNVGDRVFFDFDKAVIMAAAEKTLKRQAAWLTQYGGVTVTVEGHCDERGTREYNLALGERRANAVKNYLVALGVDAGRIATISYGKERPEALGHNEAAWSQNRRSVTAVN